MSSSRSLIRYQIVIVRTDASERPIFIGDRTGRYADHLAFSPNGELLATALGTGSTVSVRKGVVSRESHPAIVRVHRTSTGAVVAEKELNPRTIAWLDDETLLLGGETLSAWAW